VEKPSISFILVASGSFDTIRRSVNWLEKQTLCNQIELIIVALDFPNLQLDNAAFAGYGSYCLIDAKRTNSVASARAEAVKTASAQIVAFMEDHTFLTPNWSEQILKRHEEDHAVVGPAMYNANPKSRVSCATMLVEYGAWLGETPCLIKHLPGHNSAYKRDVLLGYGDQLAQMLEAESLLHWELCDNGFTLFFEPTAKTYHLNFSKWGTYLQPQFLVGRIFASTRARDWSVLKRIIYSGGAILLPLIRLRRILNELPRAYRDRFGYALAALLPLVCVSALGEMIGYLLGIGRAQDHLNMYEFRREQHIRPGEIAFELPE
jgi:hypothetical protein